MPWTVLLRSTRVKVLLREGDTVLGTHNLLAKRRIGDDGAGFADLLQLLAEAGDEPPWVGERLLIWQGVGFQNLVTAADLQV